MVKSLSFARRRESIEDDNGNMEKEDCQRIDLPVYPVTYKAFDFR